MYIMSTLKARSTVTCGITLKDISASSKLCKDAQKLFSNLFKQTEFCLFFPCTG